MNIKKICESRKATNIVILIVSIGVVLAIFQAGVFVGFHKASFLFGYGDNYYKTFGNRNNMPMFRDEPAGGHGVTGKIIKVSLPIIVVLGPDNVEKIVTTNDDTSIRSFRNSTSTEGLSVDQFVTIIGSPTNDGTILAKFIRIMPAVPMMNNASTSQTESHKNINKI